VTIGSCAPRRPWARSLQKWSMTQTESNPACSAASALAASSGSVAGRPVRISTVGSARPTSTTA
jgi:hypothetical protein